MKKIFQCCLFLLFVSLPAAAAVRTWDGGGADANWATAANWVGDVAPANGDDLVFPAAAAQYATVNNTASSNTYGSLTIEGGNYTIGGFTLRLANGMTAGAGAHNVNTLMIVAPSQTYTAAAGATVTIAAVVVLASPPLFTYTLTLDGEGGFLIGAVSGGGNLAKRGLGAALVASASNYGGAINHDNGILVFDGNAPVSAVTINSPTTPGGPLGFSGFGGTGTVGPVSVVQGVISAGTLSSPTGILNTGNLNFTANGNYVCKIGGATPGAAGHDQLNVVGAVTLANARLAPVPWNAYRPALGETFVILRNDGTDAINGTFLNAPEGAVFGGALNTAFRITYRGGDGNDVAITRVNRAAFDFDGDGRSDVSVFRPSNNTWNAVFANGALFAANWGTAGDRLAPADYDGDNKTDLAVYRGGVWWIFNSGSATVSTIGFGLPGDVPVPNDFDGDGRADPAVWRPSDGVWYQLRSLGNQFAAVGFGTGGDQPLMGDFDGDGLGDPAVYRPSNGTWHLLASATGAYSAFPFGIATDRPCAADFDGDGRTDPCVFRATADPAQPDFYILRSSDGAAAFISWGLPGDAPTLADFDGDGRTDVGIYRSASGQWFWLRSSNSAVGSQNFGQTGDVPIPSVYVP